MFRFIVDSFVLLVVLGCSSQLPKQISNDSAINKNTPSKTLDHGNKQQGLAQKLMAFHREWQGTPYRYGGMNKRGVDCSGFVSLVYQQILGQELPRTTAKQIYLGESIAKSELQIGDLIFFKTGWLTRHVGVYVWDNRFLHASTSQGVMISLLDNSYWKQKYWQSRHL